MLGSDRGSAPAEFALVGSLLTVLTLSVLQLGLALHVRNTVTDAAAEGARVAALAGATPQEGVERTRQLLAAALGDYPVTIEAGTVEWAGLPVVEMRVTAPLPVLGLVGIERGLEVSGHAPLEDP